MKPLCLILCLLLLTAPVHAQAPLSDAAVSAASCVLYDPLTGIFLYEKAADEPRPIASTTKLMTALTVLMLAGPGEVVTIPDEAVNVEGSRIYVKAGEQLTVETLLYGLLLASGNDAAIALAVHCAGSADEFASHMNALARDMGLTATHFENPHGLHAEGHVSTARELALITARACEDALLRGIMSSRSASCEGYRFRNHNKLLWRMADADGGKTGFTRAAGRCLCSTAVRDGRRLICVTLNDPDDWNDHVRLYGAAFGTLCVHTALSPGAVAQALPVAGGFGARVPVTAPDGLCAPVFAHEQALLSTVLQLPQFVYAPVGAHTPAGSATLCVGGTVLATTPLVYAEAVSLPAQPRDLPGRLREFFRSLGDRLRHAAAGLPG